MAKGSGGSGRGGGGGGGGGLNESNYRTAFGQESPAVEKADAAFRRVQYTPAEATEGNRLVIAMAVRADDINSVRRSLIATETITADRWQRSGGSVSQFTRRVTGTLPTSRAQARSLLLRKLNSLWTARI